MGVCGFKEAFKFILIAFKIFFAIKTDYKKLKVIPVRFIKLCMQKKEINLFKIGYRVLK